MKTTWAAIGLVFLSGLVTSAQTKQGDFGNKSTKLGVVVESVFAVSERGPHHRVWSRVTAEIDAKGRAQYRTNSYVELATGMNFLNEKGEWEESKEEIEILPNDKGAIAAKGQHKVIFPPDVYDGQIEMQQPDGKWLVSRVLGLSYLDTASGQSVLIAEITNSVGEVQGDNVVVYPDAFTDFQADLRYTYTRQGFEQDVILRGVPPLPEEFGLNPETTRLQVLTEFFKPPAPKKEGKRVASKSGVEMADESLDFGAMQMGLGKAFSEELEGGEEVVPVAKGWQKIEGRDFLIEEVQVKDILPSLDKLRKSDGAGLRQKSGSVKRQASLQRQLPSRLGLAGRPAKTIRQAKLSSPASGLVLDYIALNTSLTNYVFQSDVTYYLSGNVTLNGTNSTFEGGTVLKYTNNVSLTVNSPVTWLGDSYRPVLLTSKDDNTVGETISGSTGNPGSSFYAANALYFNAAVANTNLVLQNLRVANATRAVSINTKAGHVLKNVQFVKCGFGLSLTNAEVSLRNALMDQVQTNFTGSSSTGRVEHLTVDKSSRINASIGSNLFVTNSLLVLVTNATSFTSVNNRTNSAASGVFQTVGAGNHYLVTGSTNRNVGTTNINTVLKTDLKKLTTFAPVVYSNVTFSVATNLNPQAQRDTSTNDLPDIGYHYDPIDYAFSGVTVTNAMLTLTNGVAIAGFNGSLIKVNNAATVISQGRADNLNRVTLYSMVQEQPIAWGAGVTNVFQRLGTNAPHPTLELRFTDFSFALTNAGNVCNFYYDPTAPLAGMTFVDSWLRGVFFSVNQKSNFNTLLAFTNNLMERSYFSVVRDGVSTLSTTLQLRNNLFYKGRVNLTYNINPFVVGTYSNWVAYENVFYNANIVTNGNAITNIMNGYNGYLTGDTQLNGFFNVVPATFAYTNGPLGRYYQQTTSFVDMGGRTASAAGLYHHTTTANQLKETNSIVDLGFHYVAASASGAALDSDGDGTPDYIEDKNGNGIMDGSETSWANPTVSITSPTNNSLVSGPLNLSLLAAASDADGTITQVQFFRGGTTNLGVVTNSPYALVWSNAAVGSHALTAVATDNAGITSTSAVVNITVTPVPAVDALRVWLKADAITGVANGGTVTTWLDSSSAGNNATQATSGNRPTYFTNILNGKPIVRFDGNNDAMTFPNFMTGFSQAELIVVLKATTNLPTAAKKSWTFGGAANHGWYPATDGSIWDDFASANQYTLGIPAQPVTQFHIYDAASTPTNWVGRINGLTLCQNNGNAYSNITAPQIGSTSASYSGDMAEILIYNRTLTEGERELLGNYLVGKYAFIPAPVVPAAVGAAALSASQVNVYWRTNPQPVAMFYTLERKPAGGSYQVVGVLTNVNSFVDSSLSPSTQYFYRIKARNYAGESAYSSEVSVTTFTSGGSIPTQELDVWYDAAAFQIMSNPTNGAAVSLWPDSSGKKREAQSEVDRPTFYTNRLNGNPAVYFSGTNYEVLNLPPYAGVNAGAEVFVVLRVADATPDEQKELFRLGGSACPFGASYLYYPNTAGGIAEDFASTSVQQLGQPNQPLDQFHFYNIAGVNGAWDARINGILLGIKTNNSFGYVGQYSGVPYCGSRKIGGGVSYNFAGDIAEMLAFERALTPDEKQSVANYLNRKYGFARQTNAPIQLAATAISYQQAAVSWQAGSSNIAVTYTVERKTGVGGSYSVIASNLSLTTFFDSGLIAGMAYYYRVHADYFTLKSDYSNEAAVTTPTVISSNLPTSGLSLWLRAGTILGPTNGSPVTTWSDWSGLNHHLTQTNGANRPVWTTNIFNGHAVVRFDGTNDYLSGSNFMSSFSEAEMFMVLKAASTTSAVAQAAWQWGGNASWYPNTNGQIIESFGSASLHPFLPIDRIDNPHLYGVAGSTNEWVSRMNGLVQVHAPGESFNSPPNPSLGTDGVSPNQSLNGDVAELLIYNRVLGGTEREAVNNYLNTKYSLVATIPGTPTNLTAFAVSSNQIALSWSPTSGGTNVAYHIERKLGTSGTYALVAMVQQAASYVDAGLSSGALYVYRVKAVNLAGASDYSNEASATTSTVATTIPLSDLKLWLKGDTGVYASYGTAANWEDQSGNGNWASQPSATLQPVTVGFGVNGNKALRFDGANDYLSLPGFMEFFEQAELFVVLKADADMPPASRSGWRMGGSTSTAHSTYPNTSGVIIDDFASTSLNTVGNPFQPLDAPHLYNAGGKAGEWISRINGVMVTNKTVNTFGQRANPTIGASITTSSSFFAGDIAEVMIFNRVLTGEERDAVGLYLNQRYVLVTNAPASPPGYVKVDAISSSQTLVTWTPVTNASQYLVERKLGAGGTYSQVAIVRDAVKFFDSGLSPQTQYYYRIKAANYAGSSAGSSEVNTTTFGVGAVVPVTDLGLWLKTDAQEWTNGMVVNNWPDVSNGRNDATQATLTTCPTNITSAVNGRPAVRFDGNNDNLNIGNFLSGAGGAEMFIVHKAAVDAPASAKNGVKFGPSGNKYPNTGGNLSEDFGTTSTKNLGNPLQPLDQYHLYNVQATNDYWESRLNGSMLAAVTGNTVSWTTAPRLGATSASFAGDIAEILVFKRTLTSAERTVVQQYLNERYALVTSVPPPPQLSLVTNSLSFITLGWTAGMTNAIGFEIERSVGTNGVFTLIATLVRGDETNFTDSALSVGVPYQYRIRAINLAGLSAYSNQIDRLRDSDGDGVSDIFEGIYGANPAIADSDGDGLPDGWEIRYHLNPLVTTGNDGASGDPDGDGIDNLAELAQGTNPMVGNLTGNNAAVGLKLYSPLK